MSPSRSLAEAFTTELAFSRGAVPIRLRVSERAQRVALRIDGRGQAVELVLPHRTPLVSGLKFLDQNRDWVEARLKDLPRRVLFADGVEVPVLGIKHRIRHMKRRSADQKPVSIEDGEIRVTGDAAHISRRVRDFLIERARQELARRARAFAQKVDREVTRISVRDMTSRWGSCSSNGSLSFSWRLIFAPEGVLTYLVAHEVSHLVVMNHGPRFWRLVESLVPDARYRQDWLRRHRTELMRFG
jgi:predicted metal-dependent hydrolase